MAASAREIAGYRLVAGLGEGGMARVYLALSRKAAGFTKLVVLKVLRSSATDDPELRRMFFDEARIAALLNHPNVVQTYEAGEDEGRLFLAMEYLEGKSLASILASRPPGELPLDVHLRIIADTLEGLHYAHELSDVDGTPLRLIHRDVSPQNVLVTFAGVSKVVDFGIAKIASSPATQSGVIKGKVGYMAPEQIHGVGVDHRADIYAAGVMIWEAIAMRRLVLRGEDEVAVLARRMQGNEPSVRTVAPPGTPEEILAICDRAMAPDPRDRHATAQQLSEALDAFLRKHPGGDKKSVASVLEAWFGEERKQTRVLVEEQTRTADESSPLIDIGKRRAISPPSIRPSQPDVVPPHSTRTAQITDLVPSRTHARPRLPASILIGGAAVTVIGSVIAVASAMGTRRAPSHAPSAAPPTTLVAPTAADPSSPPATTATPANDPEPEPEPDTAAAASASATASASASASATAPKPVVKKKEPRRPIDDGDPYRR